MNTRLVQSVFLVLENGALISIEEDIYSYRGLNDLLSKKLSLAVVEGDCVLSANNCQADEIPAAQSLWWRVGGRDQGSREAAGGREKGCIQN